MHSLKVLDHNGQTDASNVIAALEYVVGQKQVNPNRPMVEFALLEYDAVAQRELAYEIGPEAARKQLESRRRAADKIAHDIPPDFLGTGIRIEDDILITLDGHENLISAVPTGFDEVEALCAEQSRVPVL